MEIEAKRKKAVKEGVVLLYWTMSLVILFLVFGAAFLIWKTKIAMFLLVISSLLLLLDIIVFRLWYKGLSKR